MMHQRKRVAPKPPRGGRSAQLAHEKTPRWSRRGAASEAEASNQTRSFAADSANVLLRYIVRAGVLFAFLVMPVCDVLAQAVPRTVHLTVPPHTPYKSVNDALLLAIPATGRVCITSAIYAGPRHTYRSTLTRCVNNTNGIFLRYTRSQYVTYYGALVPFFYESVRLTDSRGTTIWSVWEDDLPTKGESLANITIEFTASPPSNCGPKPVLAVISPPKGTKLVGSASIPIEGVVTSSDLVESVSVRQKNQASAPKVLMQPMKIGSVSYSFKGVYTAQPGEVELEFGVNTVCGPSTGGADLELVLGPTIDPTVRNIPLCPVECDDAWRDGSVEPSGNFNLDPPDVSILGSTPIKFERFYNSADPISGPFGRGWTHNYNIQAVRVRNPDTGQRSTIVRWGDGTRLTFVEGDGGSLTGPPGFILASASNSTGRLILVTPNKTIYSFDSAGFIEQIQHEHGRSLSFVYGDTHHRLTSIVADTGTKLDIDYKDKSDPANFKVDAARASTGEVAKYGYTSEKQLLDATDAAGGTNSYAYARNKRLSSVADTALGPIMEAKYDAIGRISEYTVRGAVGATTRTFAYDPAKKKTTVKYSDNSVREHGYDAFQKPSLVTDPVGGTRSYSVNAQLQVTSTVDAIGRPTKYGYSPEGHITSVQAADGTSTVVTLTRIQGVERPTEVRLPSGAISRIDYDLNTGLPIMQTDQTGKRVAFEHDARGRTTRVTRGSNLVTAAEYADHGAVKKISVTTMGGGSTPRTATTLIDYNEALHPVKVTDPENNVTETVFDARGRPLTVKDAAGGTTMYTRDSRGNVIEREDARGHKTYAKFDSVGRLEWQENHKRQRTTNLYDPKRGFLLSKSNFRGETTSWEYDKAGRVTKTTNPDTTFTSTTYDLAGQVTSVTNARGFLTRFGYDSVGRLVVTTNPDGTTERKTYDKDGHLTSEQDGAGRVTTYVVDAAGRVTETHLPDGESMTKTVYDADGRPVEELDPLGKKTKTEYDDLGRAFRTTVAADTPEEIVYTTEFDRIGRVTAVVTGKGSRWAYTYDGVGRKTSETDPLGSTRSWKYDKAGNIQEVTEPDAAGPIVTTFEHDELNRPRLIVRPDERVLVEYIDVENRTKTTITRNGVDLVIERAYDKLNRLISEKVGDKIVGFEYNQNSGIKAVLLGGSPILRYEYDSRDRCTKITDVRAGRVVEMAYNAASEMTSLTYPSGVKKSLTYGRRGETKSISYSTSMGVPIRSISYAYDKALRVSAKTEAPGGTTAYEYDKHDRLTKVTYPNATAEEFAYDAAGNIKTYTSPAGIENRCYDEADQIMMSYGARRAWYEFNKRGQLTKITTPGTLGDRHRNLRFDSSGRVLSIDDDGSSVLSAAYRDNYELHATRFSGDSTTDTMYVWAMGNIFTEFNALGTEQNFVVHALGMDTPIEVQNPAVTGSGRETLLTDLLQTALAGRDDAGSVIHTAEFNAYGTLRSGTDTGPVGFHGARKLGSTGLLYLRNRIYDPSLGRFLSRDPLGWTERQALHAYAANSPSSERDPTGLFAFPPNFADNFATLIVSDLEKGLFVVDLATLVSSEGSLTVGSPIPITFQRRKIGFDIVGFVATSGDVNLMLGLVGRRKAYGLSRKDIGFGVEGTVEMTGNACLGIWNPIPSEQPQVVSLAGKARVSVRYWAPKESLQAIIKRGAVDAAATFGPTLFSNFISGLLGGGRNDNTLEFSEGDSRLRLKYDYNLENSFLIDINGNPVK